MSLGREQPAAVERYRSKSLPKAALRQKAKKCRSNLMLLAIENEVAEYLAEHQQRQDANGHRLVTRNGHLPARTIQTGVGALEVRQPRVRDTRIDKNGHPIRFCSNTLPPWSAWSRIVMCC